MFARGETDSDKLTRFVAGSAVSTAAQALAGIFAMVWAVLMQNMLGPGDYGILGPFLYLFQILAIACSFGLPQAVIALVSHNARENPDLARAHAAEGGRLLAAIGSACLLISVLSAIAADAAGLTSRLGVGLTLCMGVALFGRMLYFGAYSVLSGHQRLDYCGVAMLASPMLMCPGSYLFVLWAQARLGSGSRADVLGAAVGMAIASAASSAVAFVLLEKSGRMKLGEMLFKPRWERKWKEQLAFGWKSAAAAIGYMALTLGVSPLVGWFAGMGWLGSSPEENLVRSGYFSAAMTYGMAAMLVTGLGVALIPAVSEADAKGRDDLVLSYYEFAMKYAMLLMAFLAAVFCSVAGPLVEWMSGPEYPAEQLDRLAAPIGTAMAISGLYQILIGFMVGLKRPGEAAVFTLSALAAQTVLFVAAARFSGKVHILADVFLVVQAVAFLALGAYLATVRKLVPRMSVVLRPVGAGIAAWAALEAASPASGPVVLACVAMAAAVYLAAAGIFGCFSRADFEMLDSTLVSLRLGFFRPAAWRVWRLFSLSPFCRDH